MNDFIATRLADLHDAVKRRPDSALRFDDGGHARIEIPSVEGPVAFEAVLEHAKLLGVPVHRVSQGSGIGLLRDEEILRMSELGAAASVEVCLFIGPKAPWEGTAGPLTPDGKYFGWRHTRVAQLEYAFLDVARAVELGIRSVLVADEGLVELIRTAKESGDLPEDLIVKASAMMGISNPVGGRILEQLGVDSLNVASDLPIGELAAFRAVCRAPLDLYIESPDALGGFTRYPEIAEIVRVAAPIHLKFGLKNAPNLYPSGGHLERAAIETGRERVRRAAIGVEALERAGLDLRLSRTGHRRPGVPVEGRSA